MATNAMSLGGFGTGALGNIEITNASAKLNSYAQVTWLSGNRRVVQIANVLAGDYGVFTVGQEVMFHVTNTDSSHVESFGLYSFATIIAADDVSITLDTAAPVFAP